MSYSYLRLCFVILFSVFVFLLFSFSFSLDLLCPITSPPQQWSQVEQLFKQYLYKHIISHLTKLFGLMVHLGVTYIMFLRIHIVNVGFSGTYV